MQFVVSENVDSMLVSEFNSNRYQFDPITIKTTPNRRTAECNANLGRMYQKTTKSRAGMGS